MINFVLAMGFALGWVIPWMFRTEEPSRALVTYPLPEKLLGVGIPLLISVHISVACNGVITTHPLPAGRAALGVALYLGGLAFWLRARAQIGPIRLRRLPEEPPLQLRCDGAFGIVRHPLYVGVLTMAAGPAIVAGQPWLALSWLASLVLLGIRAGLEEERLHDQIGPAYAEYCARVKRLVPFVW